jgi:hypothetical protein
VNGPIKPGLFETASKAIMWLAIAWALAVAALTLLAFGVGMLADLLRDAFLTGWRLF